MALLSRRRRMTREEFAWRVNTSVRTLVERAAVQMARRRWVRDDIGGVLAADVAGEPLRDAIAARHWDTVHEVLVNRIRGRANRFALDPNSATAVRDAVRRRWPTAVADSTARADELLAGRYDLLGYGAMTCAAADGRVDWHLDPMHHRRAPRRFWADVPYLDAAVGDHKIIWELNRHQHWLRLGRALWMTGDLRYARHITDELEGWLAANPPLVGINWASTLELSLRAISWTWALHFLVGMSDAWPPNAAPSPPWLVDMFIALDRQLTHVERHLSVYFSPNTHLTGEALALYVVGIALPELAGSRRWTETGRRILLEELDRQIRPDGGHVERSTHYQRYTLDFYLMALVTAERAGDTDAVLRFAGAVSRLADFTRTMADDAGRLPLIGDDDGGMLWPFAGRACPDVRDSLALASVLLDRPALAPWGMQEEVAWVAGPVAIGRMPCRGAPHASQCSLPSRTFTDSGYVVARDSAGSHAVFNVGRLGYLNGGHAHAHALAITLTLTGRQLLVDPGTSTYTMDQRLRDRLRSSMSHNTVTVGGRSQAVPSGPFHWLTRVDATLDGWLHGPGFDWAEASHDGYFPVEHRRTLLRTADSGWLVVDTIVGEGVHDASAHWHFHPDWALRSDAPGRLHATHVEGSEAWLLHDAGTAWLARGDDESGLGWYAPAYGTLVPTWTARVAQRATAPATMVTWIGAGDPTGALPSLERVALTGDPDRAAVGARVVTGQRTSVFLLQPGGLRADATHECGILDYETDARALHYLEGDGGLERLDLVGASYVRARSDGWLSLAASEVMADLHVTLQGGIIDLQTSRPPEHLRVQGGAICSMVSMRLNQWEFQPPGRDQADTLVLSAADWTGHPS